MTRRIWLIQLLRAGAALSVATLHVLNDAAVLAPSAWPTWLHDALPWSGGVDLFFVISGFVMVHASGALFGHRDGPRRFLLHRFVRIVPLYWLMTVLFLLAAALSGSAVNSEWSGWQHLLASLMFIPWARGDGMVQPVYSLGWTLNYEFFFYIVFALFLWLRRPWALAGVAVALLALVALRGMLPTDQVQMRYWSDPIVLEFVAGMGVAVLCGLGLTLRTPIRWALLAGGVMLGLVLQVWAPGLQPLWRLGLPAVPLVVAAVLGADDDAPRAGVLAWMVMLGDASYALYLVHPFPMRALTRVMSALHMTGPSGAAVLVPTALLAAIIAALMLHRWVERPLTKALRRFTGV